MSSSNVKSGSQSYPKATAKPAAKKRAKTNKTATAAFARRLLSSGVATTLYHDCYERATAEAAINPNYDGDSLVELRFIEALTHALRDSMPDSEAAGVDVVRAMVTILNRFAEVAGRYVD